MPGVGEGNISATGFDYGVLGSLGSSYLYPFNEMLPAGEDFTATLTWFRERTYDPDPGVSLASDISGSNLNLYLVDLETGERIASSSSTYNNSEHLRFTLPKTSQYGIEVEWLEDLFGIPEEVPYGLAWRTQADSSPASVPEPSNILGLIGVGVAAKLGKFLKRALTT